MIKSHVLLPQASELDRSDAKMKSILTPEAIRGVTDLIPDLWLEGNDGTQTPAERREVYYQFLTNRIQHSAIFVNEAKHARD
jgi:hypothetical protein